MVLRKIGRDGFPWYLSTTVKRLGARSAPRRNLVENPLPLRVTGFITAQLEVEAQRLVTVERWIKSEIEAVAGLRVVAKNRNRLAPLPIACDIAKLAIALYLNR